MANTPNIVRAVGNQLGTTLNTGISSSASSITLVDATGFSTDGGYIIIDENITGKEEIVYITGVAGSTLMVATDGRGRCGTSATSHDAGATVSDILVDEHINGIADKFIIEHNDDGTHTEDYATLTGIQKLTNKTLTAPLFEGTIDGWIDANESWSYASASTITVPSGAAAKYAKGDRIKLTQTTVKYFVVVGVADTVLTVTGGDDYTVANAAISDNYYSHCASPVGYPCWFTWTTTPSAVAPMTYSSVSYTINRFSVTGEVCHFIIEASGTTGGTAGTTITFTLPITSADDRGNFAARLYDGATLTGNAFLNSSTTVVSVRKVDSSNWGLGTLREITVSGFYEIA